MTLDELYKLYGQQMIQQEILSSQINATKKQIADELNKPVVVPEAK